MKHQTEFGEIPIEWQVKQVIDIKNEAKRAIAMGPFGSNIKADNFVESGVPVIRGTNMNFAKFVDGEFVFLTEEKADELLGSNCQPNDLVFTHRGTIGEGHFYTAANKLLDQNKLVENFISGADKSEPYRVCRRVNILRDYPDDKIKIYP
ncbi:hypothetical protein [Acinetobacter pittii]|uniref:hypothetical protein n=1 Tax=Acinetobacter pittii TaxID=48296 RepID=UPI00300A2BE5